MAIGDKGAIESGPGASGDRSAVELGDAIGDLIGLVDNSGAIIADLKDGGDISEGGKGAVQFYGSSSGNGDAEEFVFSVGDLFGAVNNPTTIRAGRSPEGKREPKCSGELERSSTSPTPFLRGRYRGF